MCGSESLDSYAGSGNLCLFASLSLLYGDVLRDSKLHMVNIASWKRSDSYPVLNSTERKVFGICHGDLLTCRSPKSLRIAVHLILCIRWNSTKERASCCHTGILL